MDGWLHIDHLREWDKNPKIKGGPSTEQVALSIKRFGFVAPIVIWKSEGRMVAGHTRLKATRRLLKEDPKFVAKGSPGPGMVRVVYHDFESVDEADMYALADNELNKLSPYNDQALMAILRDMSTRHVDLKTGTGFYDWDLNRLMEKHNRPCPEVDEKTAVDLQKRWKTSKGQIWEMESQTIEDGGTHRVMCGNSLDPKDMAKLMKGTAREVVVTDPPYEMAGLDVWKSCGMMAPRACIMTGGSQATSLLTNSKGWRYCLDLVWRHRQARLLRRGGSSVNNAIMYHQWILLFAKGKTEMGWKRPVSGYGTVIEIEGAEFDFEFMGHGKSCEIFATMMRGFHFEKLADPFLGGGSTLIAAENLGHELWGMELDPAYFAAVLERGARAGMKPKQVKK